MKAHGNLSTFRKLWRLLTPRERRRTDVLSVLMTIGMLLEALGIGMVVPAIMLMMNEDLAARFPIVEPLLAALGYPSQAQLVVGGILMLVAIYAVKTAYLAMLAWKQAQHAFGVRARASQDLFTIYLRQPWTFHLQRNSSKLVRNTMTETQQLVQYALNPSLVLFSELLLLIGIGTLLLVVEPVGALVVVTVLGLASLAYYMVTRQRMQRWGALRQHADGQRIQHLQQGLSGAKDVMLLGREDEFLASYRECNEQSARMAQYQSAVSHLPRLWLEMLAVIGLAVLVVAMLLQNRNMAALLPVLGLFAAAAFRLMPSTNKVLTALNALRFGASVIDNLSQELALAAPPPRPPGAQHAHHALREGIRLDDIHFGYEDQAAPALNGVSLEIRRGESVGFIGPSGAGKSTLVDVILGLLRPDSGSVLVDGVDIHTQLRRWQDQVGYVPQTIYLTDDTLRRNIAFGIAEADIDDDAVWRAICAAQLDTFIASLPDGVGTVVGERGVRLSGGQRQRIGIARALYHDPAVLVLDEATSALDTQTEQGVMAAVDGLHGDKTILIVAHRLSTVAGCDRLYRMHAGRIIGEGAPSVLFAHIEEEAEAETESALPPPRITRA